MARLPPQQMFVAAEAVERERLQLYQAQKTLCNSCFQRDVVLRAGISRRRRAHDIEPISCWVYPCSAGERIAHQDAALTPPKAVMRSLSTTFAYAISTTAMGISPYIFLLRHAFVAPKV